MSKEVNLISSRRKEESLSFRHATKIKRISYVMLGICVLISIALFGLNSTSELGSLTSKESTLSQTLLSSKKKIIKIGLIRDRLSSISSLGNSQSSYNDVITSVSHALTSDSSFDSFELTKKNLTIIVSSSSLLSINSFLDFVIEKLNKKELFQKVTVSSLIGDIQTGKYILNMDITLL